MTPEERKAFDSIGQDLHWLMTDEERRALEGLRDRIQIAANECRAATGIPCQSEYSWHADAYQEWADDLDTLLQASRSREQEKEDTRVDGQPVSEGRPTAVSNEAVPAENDRLIQAFVQGAQWWEYDQTDSTMWPSDRARAYQRADQLLTAGDLGLSHDERIKKRASRGER